jgi:hypothetical protein
LGARRAGLVCTGELGLGTGRYSQCAGGAGTLSVGRVEFVCVGEVDLIGRYSQCAGGAGTLAVGRVELVCTGELDLGIGRYSHCMCLGRLASRSRLWKANASGSEVRRASSEPSTLPYKRRSKDILVLTRSSGLLGSPEPDVSDTMARDGRISDWACARSSLSLDKRSIHSCRALRRRNSDEFSVTRERG